jgi:hypothetical protein
MIENITGNNLDIITQKRIFIKDKNFRKYTIDEKNIQKYYFLSIRNGEEHNYNYDLLKFFNIYKPNVFKKYSFESKTTT